MKRSYAFLLIFTVSALGEFTFASFRTSLFTLTLNVNHFLRYDFGYNGVGFDGQ